MKSVTNLTNKFGVFLLICCIFLGVVICEESTQKPVNNNETLHLFLLAVPESAIHKLESLNRFRQEDEDAPVRTFAQTGQHLGQIIRGVLGGDFRPIFAGSLQFVEEPMAQQNLNSFLSTIAPALNLGLREIYNRASNYLGIAPTTETPAAANATSPTRTNQTIRVPIMPVRQPTLQEIISAKLNSSSISPTDTVVVLEHGENENKTVTVYIGQEVVYEQKQPTLEEQLFYQQQFEQKPEDKVQTSTSSWQYVLNQIYGETTTPEALPLIQLRSSTPEDVDYDDIRKNKLL